MTVRVSPASFHARQAGRCRTASLPVRVLGVRRGGRRPEDDFAFARPPRATHLTVTHTMVQSKTLALDSLTDSREHV